MSMLKCGQKDNKKYTFGVRKDQMEEVEAKEVERKELKKICCGSCGTYVSSKSSFCPSCGGKV